MTKLSPKAVRFVDLAVRQSEDSNIRAAWEAGRPDAMRGLSVKTVRMVLLALDGYEHELQRNLGRPHLDEDAASDLSNDLGFVRAIETDLRRELEPQHREYA